MRCEASKLKQEMPVSCGELTEKSMGLEEGHYQK